MILSLKLEKKDIQTSSLLSKRLGKELFHLIITDVRTFTTLLAFQIQNSNIERHLSSVRILERFLNKEQQKSVMCGRRGHARRPV